MSDFQRFYGLNVHTVRRVEDPSYVCDLLDGLEGIDGSLYRAWQLEHYQSDGESDGGGRRTLSYVSWTQSQMILLELSNNMEAVRTMLARVLGDRKAQPNMLLPPGVEPVEEKPRGMSLANMSFDSIEAALSAMFRG